MTRMESLRLRAIERRVAHAGRCELVALMDQITDTYPLDRRPPQAAAVHDLAAARLAATTKET